MSNKILLVEDEPNLSAQIRFCLQQEGFDVTVASNGVEALDVVNRARPDLILTDVMMPHMDGHALCDAVRRREDLSAIPFVFLTAKGQKEDRLRARELGADDYLTKPFEVDDLLSVVRARLKRVAEITSESERRLRAPVADSISHELRTPLTIIQGLVSILQSQPELDPETQRELLKTVHENGDVLNKLVENLLSLKSADSGDPLPTWDLDLRDVLLSVCRNFRDACQKKRLVFGATLPASLPSVRGNRGALLLLFSNVLDNAVRYTPDGGRVEIAVALEGEAVAVTIRDTGVGLNGSAIPHVFEPFYRDEPAGRESPGLGLGLSIALKLTRVHAGSLDIASKKHQGTAVTVRLPLSSAARATKPGAA